MDTNPEPSGFGGFDRIRVDSRPFVVFPFRIQS
jgi:hypothetical protein